MVLDFTDQDGNRESIQVDRRGRYFINGKSVSLAKAFRFYADKAADPNVDSATPPLVNIATRVASYAGLRHC